jgi:hypothetical protein
MSLLTNEQISELACIASNQSTSRDLHDELHDWNEKQFFGIEVEPNWENAPVGAITAVFSMRWYDENGNLLLSDIFEEFPKPVTPHPHAEMIMKYAEVAQRRVDPWVEFEWGKNDSHWCSCDRWINFNIDNCYRHIGETK